MSSRILQEDSDLLLTESGDSVINDNFIGASGFVTGNPTLATTSIIQVHNILCDSITTTNAPTLATTSISQVHNILCDSITTGNITTNFSYHKHKSSS
jgi:citrate lyase alpha subunit